MRGDPDCLGVEVAGVEAGVGCILAECAGFGPMMDYVPSKEIIDRGNRNNSARFRIGGGVSFGANVNLEAVTEIFGRAREAVQLEGQRGPFILPMP